MQYQKTNDRSGKRGQYCAKRLTTEVVGETVNVVPRD